MFKKLSLIVSLAGLLALVLAVQGWSQQRIPPSVLGGAATRHADRLYNPQKVETMTGTVVAVNRITAKRPGRPDRVMMDLKTGQGIVKVYLGPADYLDHQELKLAPGDQIEVKGMRVNRPKLTIFIAGAVTKGGQVLQLRDDATGRPLWAKGKKRNLS